MNAGIDTSSPRRQSQADELGGFPGHSDIPEEVLKTELHRENLPPGWDHLMVLSREYSCLCGFALEAKPSNISDGKMGHAPLEEGLKSRYILRCWRNGDVLGVRIQVGMVLEQDVPYCLMPVYPPGCLFIWEWLCSGCLATVSTSTL